MAIFNKVLNILIFILAGVSVTFGFFLFEKREELRRRGDTLAKVVNEVSKKLDEGTGTEYHKDLRIDKRLEVNPEKEGYKPDNLKVSLWHNNYAKLNTVLGPFKDQARDIIIQRDQLGSTLHQVLKELEIPVANEFEAPTFMDNATYAEQDTKLLAIITKVTARDKAINQQIADSVGVMGGSLDPEGLWHLEEYTTPLGEFATVAQKLKDRSDTYATAIGDLCEIFEINSPSLSGEDYSSALDTVRTEMRGEKQKFEQTKTDLAQTKQELKEAKITIEEQIGTIEQRDKEIVRLNKLLEIYLPKEGAEEAVDMAKLKKALEGKILRVNDKWGFVVIDLGLNNKMIIGDKEKVEKTVPLDEDKRMDVARGSKYLGQIHIIKVAQNCAIGNIVPETITGKMEVGDKVFFPNENKSINTEKLEDKFGDEELINE